MKFVWPFYVVDEMAHRRPNKGFRVPSDEEIAGDRMNTYPMNQFAVTAGILFAVIVVIALLYAIGVVKP